MSDKRLVENDLCTISIVACMKEDQGATDSVMCLWRVQSQLHNFTGMYDHICVCVCVCTCVHVCISVHARICVCVCQCVSVHVRRCV